MDHFSKTLEKHNLELTRQEADILQINVGLLCNQKCRHCHLDAGPERTENMSAQTAEEIIPYAKRSGFETIDITGGAPELNPNLPHLIKALSQIASKITMRSNLSVLDRDENASLIDLLKSHKIGIVASLPSIDESQTNAQRGNGIFNTSISVLKKLNDKGYGQEDNGLELNLVSNPTGAFLPPSQDQSEKRFKELLERRFGIVFNHLYSFANVPIGRFREWLETSGNLENYMDKLAKGFNPCAVEGVMCRTLVSVDWDGYLYDCDFNLARGIPLGGRKKAHVSEMDGKPEPCSVIATADHCYTCTAGSGFT
jgi:radical SAM/Cys-rich protein